MTGVELRQNAAASAEAWALLVARAAHDLNNHLAAILGKAEVSLMVEDPARWRRGLLETLDAGRAARTVVADLQCVASWRRSDATPVPLAEVLAVAARLTTPALQRRGVDLLADETAPSIVIEAPGERVLAVWLLVHDGVVRAGTNRDPLVWRLGASATPAGAWTVTFSTPGSRASAASSTLDLAREIVEANGGRLEIDAEASRITLRR